MNSPGFQEPWAVRFCQVDVVWISPVQYECPCVPILPVSCWSPSLAESTQWVRNLETPLFPPLGFLAFITVYSLPIATAKPQLSRCRLHIWIEKYCHYQKCLTSPMIIVYICVQLLYGYFLHTKILKWYGWLFLIHAIYDILSTI